MSDVRRMSVHEAGALLEGKTIAKVNTFTYLGWPCIEDITFTDGTVLDLSGNADVCIMSDINDGGDPIWLEEGDA